MYLTFNQANLIKIIDLFFNGGLDLKTAQAFMFWTLYIGLFFIQGVPHCPCWFSTYGNPLIVVKYGWLDILPNLGKYLLV